MGIDGIPGPQVFRQRDVRRTEAGGISQTNFNTDDFEVATGVVTFTNKTRCWSCTPIST